jgi:1-acyl-sn-glycerol-3-phosphate acyltransferase
MQFIKNIFGRVWAIWGIISFIVSFLLILIPSYITSFFKDPKGVEYFINISRLWMRVWLTLVGCPVNVRGTENFKKGHTYIVTCNHNALLDIPLSSPFIPGANQTIAKKSFVKIPLFGWYYKRGSVIVDRESDASRRKSFEGMRAALENGMHMCIYPEGTRNRSSAPLKKFYDGAFKLAVETNHAIIPAIIFNTGKALPANKFFYFLPTRLSIHFLPPIATDGLTADALKEKVYQTMFDYYTANY